MYGQTDATDPAGYLASVDEAQRPQIAALAAQVVAAAPELTPRIDRGMLAYGHYHYRYATGREGDWFVLAIASNKQYISIYAPTVDLAPMAARLGKVSLGRQCIRVKRIDDLDLSVLDEVIRSAARDDGATITSDSEGRRLG